MADELEKAFAELLSTVQNIGNKPTVTKSPSVTKPQVASPKHKSSRKFDVAVMSALSEDEVKKMASLATCERDKLFVLTLFYSALRKMECLSLTPSNLQVDTSHLLIIQPKGQRAHEVGMPPWLMTELVAYVKTNNIKPNEKIFDISAFEAWRIVKSLCRKIGKYGYPHLLRHSRAIDLAKENFQENEVSRHLGHVSDKTVKIYFRFRQEGEVADKVVKHERQ